MPDPVLPERVDVNVRSTNQPPIDPLQGMPAWLRIAANFTTTGIICAMFIWMSFQMWNVRDDGFKQAEQSYSRYERLSDKLTSQLDKFKSDIALELAKFRAEIATELQKHSEKADKNIEFRDMQNKDWIRNTNEKNQLNAEKIQAELKNLTDQFKLMIDRLKLTQMKE